MLCKPVIFLTFVLLGLCAAEKLTFGSRKSGDRYLFTQVRSTLPTVSETKHELIIEEGNVKITYLELNISPVSQNADAG